MGWTFFDAYGRKPNEILVREYTQPMQRTDGTLQTQFDVVDHATRGRVWYAVVKTTNPDGYSRHFCAVVLWTLKNGEFGHKDMTDRCGPYVANAPLRIVDALDRLDPLDPTATDSGTKYALQWRQRCRDNAKPKPKRDLQPGMRVKFSNVGGVFELLRKAGPRRGWFVQIADGITRSTYRATAQQIANATIV